MRRHAVLLALLLATVAGGGDLVRTEAARLRFNVPAAWTRVPATGDASAASYRLPSASGDLAETLLVLRAGPISADAQLDVWYGRLAQPDGTPSSAAANVLKRKVGELRVTRVDLGGTYVGSATGRVQGGVSGYRLLGAVVEGDGGPWVFEIFGPKATVGAVRAEFDALLLSLELH